MPSMFLNVDGHAIPIFTEADFADDEERAAFDKSVTGTSDPSGHLEVTLVGSDEKATMYDVHASTDSGVVLDYTLVRPPGGAVPMSISSLRPFRVKGREDHQADALHQVRLFHAVGSVAVAGGHVEMAMKRVLVSLLGGQNHDLADVPADWSRLQSELERLSRKAETGLQAAVIELLSGHEATHLRESRNNVIHGYWWLIPMGRDELVVSRYFRPNAQQQPANSHPSAATLQKLAGRLFAFAGRLEALVTPEWPLAIVPALGSFSGDVTLRERLDDQTTKSSDLRPSNTSKPRPGQKPASNRNGSHGKRKKRR